MKKHHGGKREGAGRKYLPENKKIEKKQVSLELNIFEFEKLNTYCEEEKTSKNALLKHLLKKEKII